MIDNTIIVEIDMPNEIDVDLGDAKFITAPEKQVPQAVPQIDVDNNGLITATSVQEAGSVRAGTTKSIYQLAVEQGKTISPSGESQVAIEKGRFAVGDIVVSPLKVQAKELNVTDGGNYEVVPDSDYLLSRVGINVDISAKVDEAFQSGAKSEYDRFWDVFQNNGKRTKYAYAFGGDGWNNEILMPKYPIKIIDTTLNSRNAIGIFYYFHRSDNEPYDMTEICKRIDFSQCKNFSNLFNNAYTINITIDASNAETMSQCFQGGDGGLNNYITVTVSEKCTDYYHAFYYLTNLTDVTFTEGSVIAANIDFIKSTKLTHESLMSIINALKNFSGTSETRACTLGEANLAKLTDAEKAIATEKGWNLA